MHKHICDHFCNRIIFFISFSSFMEEKVFFPFNSPSRVVRVERVSAYGWKQQQKDRRMSKRFFFGGKNCLEEKKESPISDRDGQLVAINISLINNVDKMYRSGLLRLTRQLTKLGVPKHFHFTQNEHRHLVKLFKLFLPRHGRTFKLYMCYWKM